MQKYSKHKDRSPEETLERIRSILDDIGIETEVEWNESGVENAYSNRIRIKHTSLGTNGKGTDKEYALASGYAELMERLENGRIQTGHQSKKLFSSFYSHSPDEVYLSAEEVVDQRDPFSLFLFSYYGKKSREDRIEFIKKSPRLYKDSPDTYACFPFACPAENRIVNIPAELMMPIVGSNGMSAGNTPEEALVQALSEILERYANRAVLNGTVPPEIPRSYWENTQISSLLYELEKDKRYNVKLLDCSLGRGIPATALVIADLERGTFGIHFSSHPSFEVSVERALTEALQGKNLDDFTSMNMIGDRKSCQNIPNYPNLLKTGTGYYPPVLFSGEPSYQFKPWDQWKNLSNREMLKKLLKMIDDEGYQVLVHDASHLGFPAYHVIVPGISEIFFEKGMRLKALHTENHVIDDLAHFPRLSNEEENRLLLYMRYRENSVFENSFANITSLPLIGRLMKYEFIRACLHYKRHEYKEAYEWFSVSAENAEDKDEKLLHKCSAEFIRLLNAGASEEQAEKVLKVYYPQEIALRVSEMLRDRERVMEKLYQPFNCDDCENCSHANINCEYPSIEKVLWKIKKALSHSSVEQKSILRLLVELSPSSSVPTA